MVWSMMVMHGLIMEMIQWGCFQLLITNYDAWSEILTDTEFMAEVLFFFFFNGEKGRVTDLCVTVVIVGSLWASFLPNVKDMGRQMHLIFYRKNNILSLGEKSIIILRGDTEITLIFNDINWESRFNRLYRSEIDF